MRVLVVEDDEKIAAFLAKGLRQEGCVVDVARDGEEGLDLAANSATAYAAIVLDIMLPKRDGLSVLSALRRDGIATPVLLLSAKRDVDDRVRGLQAGGDDYLVKPFAFSELLARLQAIHRRATLQNAPESTLLTCADLHLDLLTRRARRGGTAIELKPKEFALLEYLLQNQGRVVSKTLMLEHVWDCAFDPQTNVVDVHVCRLRQKIDRDFQPKLIHTMRGVGYVLREEN
jgi:two-component system OmpR family response regulator